MPDLTHALSSNHGYWTSRKLSPQERSFILPFEDPLLPLAWFFRKISSSSYALDIVTISRHVSPSLVPSNGERQLEGDQRARVSKSNEVMVFTSFDLDEETRQPDLEAHLISLNSPEMNGSELFGVQMIAPRIYFTERPFDSEKIVKIPKFEDGNGSGSTWTRLTIPQFLDLPYDPGHSSRDKSVLYRGEVAPSIFNVLTGRLYVCRPNGLHVIQY